MTTSSFLSLTSEAWARWIIRFVEGQGVEPPWPVSEDRYAQQVLALYRHLQKHPAAREAMLDGLSLALQTTPKQAVTSETWYHLLHAAGLLTPLKSRSYLRTLLKTGALTDLHFGPVWLHGLLLAVTSKFGVDEELIRYIQYSVREATDMAWLLTCFRILSSHNLDDNWSTAARILERKNDSAETDLFADELRTVSDEQGWPSLYKWYGEGLKVLKPELLEQLLAIIETRLIPFIEYNGEEIREPAFHLMKAHAAVAARNFDTNHLLVLARFVASTSGLERQTCLRGMHSIYDFGKRQSKEPLWDYVDHDEELPRRMRAPARVVGVYCRGDSNPQLLSKDIPEELQIIDTIVDGTPDRLKPLFGGKPAGQRAASGAARNPEELSRYAN